MRCVLTLLAMTVLSGCGTMKCALLDDCKSSQAQESNILNVPSTRIFNTGQQIKDYSTIVITRDDNFVDSGCFDVISVNDKLSARIGINERITINVVPGELTIKASNIDLEGPSRCYLGANRSIIREFTIAKGSIKKFRITHNLNPVDIDIQRSE